MRRTIIGLALLAFASGEATAQTNWRVSESSGDVRVAVNGQTRPVTRGMLLASGSVVASNSGGRAVLVSGRDYVVLSPSSRVRLPGAPARVIPAGSPTMATMTQVISEAGTALYRIEHRATPHFRVQTPYLAAVVKGTVFSVTVNRTGASVQVTQGAVEVSTVDGGAAELVRPGMVAMVRAGDLRELTIHGDVNRSIRSNGTPQPGVATVPVADAGRYDGPADASVEIAAPVREDPVSLADATDGLVSGQAGANLALADVRDGVHPGAGHGGADNSGNAHGNGGPGNNNGRGNGGPGSGGSDDDHGNNGGGNGGPGNGGDDDDHGNNGGGGNDNSGPGDDSGHGNDDDGDDDSNPGNGGGHGGGHGIGPNICLPADLACVNLGQRPH